MAVKIGSARIDENGKAHGGKAGDQTGREVSTQNWYNHSKGWRVFRAIDKAKAEKIAKAMEMACANSHIGYDQYQRNTLYTEAEKFGFDISKVTKNVETDCSALVRVCCAYAGIRGLPSGFRTGNMPTNLMGTGAFVEMIGTKYTASSDRLERGDILVTKSAGHTVVVLNNGPKVVKVEPVPIVELGARSLRYGCYGEDVKQLQAALIRLGYDLSKWGDDGDFGAETLSAVNQFKLEHNLKADGIFGAKAVRAIKQDLEAL